MGNKVMGREDRIKIAVRILNEWLSGDKMKWDYDRGPSRRLSVALGIIAEVHKEMEEELIGDDKVAGTCQENFSIVKNFGTLMDDVEYPD